MEKKQQNKQKKQWTMRISLAIALSFLGLLFLTAMPASAVLEVITLQGQQDKANDDPDKGHFSQVTADGGRVTITYTRSSGGGNKDVYVVKSDKDDVIEWERSFGGNGDDEARHIQQTTDGGYILTGYTTSQGSGGRDLYVVKMNKWGDKTWDLCVGGSADDEGSYIQQTLNGSYIAVGYTKSSGAGDADALAIGIDKNGKKTFQKTYGGKEADYACSAQVLNNGGFLIVGATRSTGNSWHIYVIRCSGSGTANWEKAIGGQESFIGAYVQAAADNEYLVVGYTFSSSQQRNLCLVKLNSSGKLLWEKIVNEQNLYGESMALALTPVILDESSDDSANELPPPESPQQKHSRKKAIDPNK